MRSTTATVESCLRRRSRVSIVSFASRMTPRSSTRPTVFPNWNQSPPKSPTPATSTSSATTDRARTNRRRNTGCRRAMMVNPGRSPLPLRLFRLGHHVGERELAAVALALQVGVHLGTLLALAERLDGEPDPLLARVDVRHLRLDEDAEVGDARDRPLDARAGRIAPRDLRPRVFRQLLDAERDALVVDVD